MAFNSDTFNDKSQISRSRPSAFGRLWQKTALRLLFVGGSAVFFFVQQPSWWQRDPGNQADATKDFSGKASVITLSKSGFRKAGNAPKDSAVIAHVKKALGPDAADGALAALPEQLSLKFQFHKAHLAQVPTSKGYDVRLTVAHFEPIARITGTALLLSRDGAIYSSDNPKNFLSLPGIRLALTDRWTPRRTLDVTPDQQRHISQAMSLMAVLTKADIPFAQLTLKPHRGFQVQTGHGLYLQFGHRDFDRSIKRYQKILKREDFAINAVKEIHLDFKGKALITMKPKAKR